jgi:hypothetical protein
MNGTNGFGGGDQPFSLQPIEIDFPAWPASQIVKDMAAKFLNALDPAGQYTFQTVNPEGPAFILNGTLDQHFPALSYQNAQGAGIYVTVNQTDLKGRKNKNIVRIRAIPVDTDGADPLNFERLPLAPSIIVRSSPGKYWFWYLLEDGPTLDWNEEAASEHVNLDYKRVVEDLARLMESDPKVKDLSHVGRLPGFCHMKNAPRSVFVSQIVHYHPEIKFKYAEFKAALAQALIEYGPVLKPRPPKSSASSPRGDRHARDVPPAGQSRIVDKARNQPKDPAPDWSPHEDAKLRTALAYRDKTSKRVWDPDDDRDTWGLKVAPAIASLAWGERGEDIFIWWSRQATQPKYQLGGAEFADDAKCRSTIRSYKPTRGAYDATEGTIYDRAYKAGWDGRPDPAILADVTARYTGSASLMPNGGVGAPQAVTADAPALALAPHAVPGEAMLESVWAADVKIEALDWFWAGRYSFGALGLVVGLPDVGKGQFVSYTAARVTRGGAFPCGEGEVTATGNVLILSSEDAPNTAIVPRLIAAGADLSRVKILKMVREPAKTTVNKAGQAVCETEKKRMFSLIDDLALLRKAIIETGNVKLVVIDPISSYFGAGKVDTFRDTDVRAVLGPVCELAEELHVAIIAVMHFNKKVDVTNALLRIANSLAFGALARHVYAVVDDPDNKRKLFVKAKNNYAPETQQALAYSFSAKVVGKDERTGKDIIAPFIEWHANHVDVTASEAMQAAADSKAPAARDQAKKFLREILAGGPVLRKQIEEAAKANGISDRTLWRAKDNLKITADKKVDGWFWALPLPPLAELPPTTLAAMLGSQQASTTQQKRLGGPTATADKIHLEMLRHQDVVAQEWKAKWEVAGYGPHHPRDVTNSEMQAARAWLREQAKQMLPEVKRREAARWEEEKARWEARQGGTPKTEPPL